MNARTAVLIFAVALIGVGLILTIRDMLAGEPPEPAFQVAHATVQIEPYTVIEQSMLAVDRMSARQAQELGAWRSDQLVGMMATNLIRVGDLMSTHNALPVDVYRGSSDMTQELVSFSAGTDALVAGQIKPGMLINIYGFKTGRPEDTYTVLLEPNVRVVSVRQGSGETAGAGTAEPQYEDTGTGPGVSFTGERARAGTLITVQLPPERAFHLIDALGAKSFRPYVTLAGERVGEGLSTPQVQVEAQPTPELPDIGATMTAIWRALATPVVQPPVTGGGGEGR
jgi:hypothetical protein